MEDKKVAVNIDEYISEWPEDKQELMQKVRRLIRDTCPESKETISWGMPTFVFHGNLIHFTANKNHLGIYPGSEAVEHFKTKLDNEKYKYTKGAIQFAYNKEMDFAFIKEIVLFNMKRNIEG